MLPHRPATASTSNPSQANVLPLRTPDASPRIRKDATTDVRYGVGRHRDKLELIRNSLRPFEQSASSCTSSSGHSSASLASSQGTTLADLPTSGAFAHDSNGEDEARRQIMINTLTQIGFEQEAALLALQLVRFSSVAAAAEVLLNINNVVPQDQPPPPLPGRLHNGFLHPQAGVVIRSGPVPSQATVATHPSHSPYTTVAGNIVSSGYSQVGALSKGPAPGPPGLALPTSLPTVLSPATLQGGGGLTVISAGLTQPGPSTTAGGSAISGPGGSSGLGHSNSNLDDSCSSRSNSPLARIPSPSTAFIVRSPSPTRQQLSGFHPQQEYHRTHAHLTLSATQATSSAYDHVLPSSSSQAAASALPCYQPSAYQPVVSTQTNSQAHGPPASRGAGAGGLACAKKVDRPHPMQATSIMSIERGAHVVSPASNRLIRPLAGPSAASGTGAHSLVNGNTAAALRRAEAVPVIRARLDRVPRNTLLQINVDSVPMSSDGSGVGGGGVRRNRYHLNAVNDESGETLASVHGQPGGMNAVQCILVDPDLQPPSSSPYTSYVVDQQRRRALLLPGCDVASPPPVPPRDVHGCCSDACASSSSAVHRTQITAEVSPLSMSSSPALYDPYHRGSNINTATTASGSSYHSSLSSCTVDADGVTRCVSPLPESVAKRIRSNSYEPLTRPCKPRMFCFFMEQHVERLIQQYKERQQRAHQLAKEMECANLPENLREQMMKFLAQKESRYLRLRRQKMDKNMFEVIRHIGFGAFGRVSLVKKKDTGQVYAMKTLLKKDVIMKQQAAHVKAERDILAEANSQWIVKLFFSFQDQQSLYFIMEYVPGGDMMQLLINKGIFSEKLARSYIAELTCAIEYVHRLGFIHRDIKPDNILIDQNGHLKLTDFGLCTGLRWTHDKRYYGPDNDEIENSHSRDDSFAVPPHLMGGNGRSHAKVLDLRHHCKRNQSHSLVGTDNYMAPEVIKGTGHTQLCDWWSVGVILYEMVYGMPPFMSEDRYETQFKIVNWRQFLDLNNRMGAKLSSECVSLIRRLCCDQEDRLGAENGAADIKMHPWFKGMDFATLRSTPAEYLPRVDHAEDTSNFETFEVDSKDDTPSSDPSATGLQGCGGGFQGAGGGQGGVNSANNNAALNPAFYEFTFRHFFDFDGQGCPSLRTQRRPSLAPVFESPGAGVLIPPPPPPLGSQIGIGAPQIVRTTNLNQYSYKPVISRTDSDGFESDESLVV